MKIWHRKKDSLLFKVLRVLLTAVVIYLACMVA